jgi:molybdopterin converting factor small subunit
LITVKAKYLQLSRAVEAKEEDFVMNSRSCYGDLLEEIRKKHPSLTYVAMLVLIDGAPPSPDTELKDGDEVDFIASPMGG